MVKIHPIIRLIEEIHSTFMGQSKLEGEMAVWAESDQACVLRAPTLYGKVEFLGETSVTQIAE